MSLPSSTRLLDQYSQLTAAARGMPDILLQQWSELLVACSLCDCK